MDGLSSLKYKRSWLKNYLFNMFLEKFNSQTGLFKKSCDLDLYANLVKHIRQFCFAKTSEERAILAYLILFDNDDATKLR